MVPDKILLRYGEIFLKGKNRSIFERKLAKNIKKIAGISVQRSRGRLISDYFLDHHKLRNVFGLISYSPAFFVEKDVEEIKRKALKTLQGREGTFKIVTKRSDKLFPIKSPEMNVLVGEFIEENSNFQFSFETPDNILKIEINQQGAYLFFDTIECLGGLPTGVEGKVDLLVENKASILAGLMFMKRGCSIMPLSFEKKDISLLQKFSPVELKLKIIKELGISKDLSTSGILVTGENYDHLKEHEAEIVMRPLISYSEETIEEELKKYKEVLTV